jgi:hypothetical protein
MTVMSARTGGSREALKRFCLSLLLVPAMACAGGSSTTTSPSPATTGPSTQTYTGTVPPCGSGVPNCNFGSTILFPITVAQPAMVTVILVSVSPSLNGHNGIVIGFGCASSCPANSWIGSAVGTGVTPAQATFTALMAGTYDVQIMNIAATDTDAVTLTVSVSAISSQ